MDSEEHGSEDQKRQNDLRDSLQATFARRKKAVQSVTRNPSHFQQVAPDIEILTP
jgi:hypothetical protein